MVSLPLHTLRIGGTTVELWERHTRTMLPCGHTVETAPEATAEYEAKARAWGYPDGAVMHRVHDVVHALLADAAGLPYSEALARVAHGCALDGEPVWSEERLVEAFCRLLNGQSDSWAVLGPWERDTGVDVGELAQRARGLLMEITP